MKLSAKTFQRV